MEDHKILGIRNNDTIQFIPDKEGAKVFAVASDNSKKDITLGVKKLFHDKWADPIDPTMVVREATQEESKKLLERIDRFIEHLAAKEAKGAKTPVGKLDEFFDKEFGKFNKMENVQKASAIAGDGDVNARKKDDKGVRGVLTKAAIAVGAGAMVMCNNGKNHAGDDALGQNSSYVEKIGANRNSIDTRTIHANKTPEELAHKSDRGIG